MVHRLNYTNKKVQGQIGYETKGFPIWGRVSYENISK